MIAALQQQQVSRRTEPAFRRLTLVKVAPERGERSPASRRPEPYIPQLEVAAPRSQKPLQRVGRVWVASGLSRRLAALSRYPRWLAPVLLAGLLLPAGAALDPDPGLRLADVQLAVDQDVSLLLYERAIPPGMTVGGPTPELASSGVGYRTYRVQRGDTISEIAQKFEVDLDTLISFNEIRRAAEIRAGQLLTVPSSSGLRYVVRRGDTLSGIATRSGVSLSALLDGNDLASETIQPGQVLFVPGGRLSENARNAVLGKLFLRPANGVITSRYGPRRHPATGLPSYHNGIDIANDQGSAITASMRGRVARVGFNSVYGRYVILVHDDAYQTLYAHMLSTAVAVGQVVAQGQRLGQMGNTGDSTGPHLHFSIFRDGAHVDPLDYVQ